MTYGSRMKAASLDVLRKRLEAAGIDLSQWGTGKAKTLEHLHAEIMDGETILVTGEDGRLLRKVVVCDAHVYATSPEGKHYRLKEDRQVFKDGRERRRNMEHAVMEKMKPHEDPRAVMIRGVKEELGLEGDIDIIATGEDEETLLSPSFPGLPSNYVRYYFAVTLQTAQFRPEGYIEVQTDKSTYFVWEEIA